MSKMTSRQVDPRDTLLRFYDANINQCRKVGVTREMIDNATASQLRKIADKL